MSKRHLFSASLFDTLFQHNLISSDGYVKATDDQILAFRKFLVQQARDKTTNLYKVRKEMVDEVCDLLKEDELSPKETKKLVMLLHQLNLKITPEGILENDEPEERKFRYFGTSEPNKSVWERQLLEEERRLEVLQRDLKELDDWLGEIGKPGTKVHKSAMRLPADSKKDEFRYRARTAKRNMDMERARRRLIATYHAENAKSIKQTLARKDYPGRVRFLKSVASETQKRKESDATFVTAESELSFLLRTPLSVTEKEMALARNIFEVCEEEDSHLKAKKSQATEKIEVQPGVQMGIDEHIFFNPTEGISTFVSEPIMVRAEDDFVVDSKSKRYKSEPTLDGKSSSVGTTIDEAKQYIIIYGDEGKETEFEVEDADRASDEKFKPYGHTTSIDTEDNRLKSILKVSRKSIKMASSSDVKTSRGIASKDNKRASKEGYKDQQNRSTTKRPTTNNSKEQKATSSSSLMRKKVPKVTQGVKDVKPVAQDKDKNDVKIENKQKIIDSKENNKEKKNVLSTCNDQNGFKHKIDSQVEGKPLGTSITPTEEKLTLKEHIKEHKDYKNRPISERKSIEDKKEGKTTNTLKTKIVPENSEGEKEVKSAGQDKDENNPKIDNKQKIIDSKDDNNEMRSILKTMDAEDENKLQAERRSNLTRGKVDSKNHDGLHDKSVKDRLEIEPEKDDVLSSEQKLSLKKDFEVAQLTEANKNDFVDDKTKMTTDNKEDNIDFEENSKKKENISTSDNKGNVEKQPKLKENATKNKKDDGQSDKGIGSHPETEPKEVQVLAEEQPLSLEKDFELAQRYELEKNDPKSRKEEMFVSNFGSEESIKDSEEEDNQKDNNIKAEKEATDFNESNPEESEVLTLDQQLSKERKVNSRRSKELRQKKSKVNSSENDGNINLKNDVERRDSSEKAKQYAEESSTSDYKTNSEEQAKLKENTAINKIDDSQSDKIIKGNTETESKKDQILTKEQHLSLEKDFELAQQYELEKNDPKSSREERFVSNLGSEENFKDLKGKDEQKDYNLRSEKEVTDSDKSNPEDSEVLTLDQQLSKESMNKSKRSKEIRQKKSKANSSENDDNINIKNAEERNDSSENAKKDADESNPDESNKDVEENR